MSQPKQESAREVFARNLRRLRRERGVTQEQLSHSTGLNQSYLSEVEAGKRNISIDNIDALAKALGVGIVVLFENRPV
ncbi:helix-turn-helix transcriptional regulator [uncultured Rhodoblastus sp.]|jgi:transcriptional regulator with XRE-family HTH domain|uniref:helix-turn-helix domain-containing protein n=1 Tax=uncultured Rhodoblastus sp. TaxID=543037 RepID=UPI0025D0A840|nr:helix-turn-helix transcriptional regulator [uncultured Rhodoblastus sp.]